MGKPMAQGKEFVEQPFLEGLTPYPAKFTAYFSQKRNTYKNTIEDTITILAKLDDVYEVDETGQKAKKDGNLINRTVCVSKAPIKVGEKAHLTKWHSELFKETLTRDLCSRRYGDGDLWLALVNGGSGQILMEEPHPNKDGTKQVQYVLAVKNFIPNPDPENAVIPPEKDVDGNVVEDNQQQTGSVADRAQVVFG